MAASLIRAGTIAIARDTPTSFNESVKDRTLCDFTWICSRNRENNTILRKRMYPEAKQSNHAPQTPHAPQLFRSRTTQLATLHESDESSPIEMNTICHRPQIRRGLTTEPRVKPTSRGARGDDRAGAPKVGRWPPASNALTSASENGGDSFESQRERHGILPDPFSFKHRRRDTNKQVHDRY